METNMFAVCTEAIGALPRSNTGAEFEGAVY